MGIEKRKAPRIPVYMKVINESTEFDFGFSYARDVSEGGLALDTKVLLGSKFDLAKGNVLKLKFKVPGGKLYVTALGEVVRIERDDDGNCIIGVKFVSLENDFKEEIRNFVEEVKKGDLSLE